MIVLQSHERSNGICKRSEYTDEGTVRQPRRRRDGHCHKVRLWRGFRLRCLRLTRAWFGACSGAQVRGSEGRCRCRRREHAGTTAVGRTTSGWCIPA